MKIFTIIFGTMIAIALSFGYSSAYAAEKTVILSVPGMTCPVCPITVKKSLTDVVGVNKVQVSYDHKTATVTFDDTTTNISALTTATKNVGYPSSVKTNKNIKE